MRARAYLLVCSLSVLGCSHHDVGGQDASSAVDTGPTDSTSMTDGKVESDTVVDQAVKDRTETCGPTNCTGCCGKSGCVTATTAARCGNNGAVCVDCSGAQAGHACVAGACGCTGPLECPDGAACDTNTDTCSSSCLLVPCKNGCCNTKTGSCETGQAQKACGLSGSCIDCSATSAGQVCLSSGVCGCEKATDCYSNSACDTIKQACTTACSPTQRCNGGCCKAGKCTFGGLTSVCGPDLDGNCTNCTSAPEGTGCYSYPSGTVNYGCGCSISSQCPKGQTCDATKGKCGGACSSTQKCNGGCCDGGTCVAGTDPATCGYMGDACVNCAYTVEGPLCLSGRCGCNAAQQCTSPRVCQGARCCLPAGSSCGTPKDCCSGLCGGISGNTKCG